MLVVYCNIVHETVVAAAAAVVDAGKFMERDCDWLSLTPGKPALTSEQGTGNESIMEEFPCRDCFGTSCYAQKCVMNEMCELPDGIFDERKAVLGVAGKEPEDDTSCVQEETVKIYSPGHDSRKACGVDESQDGIGSIPTPSKTKETRKRKRRNDGNDTNKKPSQRPRVKKHRPKIFDDSKPKKVPKVQTLWAPTSRVKTPNPATRGNWGQERRVQSTKKKIPDSTNCGTEDAGQDVQEACRASIIVGSCKRSLDFGSQSKSHEEPPLPGFDFFRGNTVTSKRNTPRRSKFQNKSLKASGNLLADNNKQQCKQDISEARNQEPVDEYGRKYVYFYQRRKKTGSNSIRPISTLQVYRRREKQCLQYSRSCGPTFPKLFKKQRMMRKKVNIKAFILVDELRKSLVTKSHRKLTQTTKNKGQNRVNKSKDKKGGVKPNLYIDEFKELVLRDQNVSGVLVKVPPPKKSKFRVKVDLDNETSRVWKLLMENDESEPIHKDKEEWWEKQRSIFRGRVDSFIAKMHLIQGNRRFSPWKGSVTDSVVGVYLTQNVSDHLSSSAFMSVAARFPADYGSREVHDDFKVPNSQESVTSNTHIYEGSTLVGDSKVVTPVGSLHSEVTMDQGVDSANNHKETAFENKINEKKKNKKDKKPEPRIDWDALRKSYCKTGEKETNVNHRDAVDWDAVRRAPVEEIAKIIVDRGMHNVIAERIKKCLDRIYKDHGTLDLEWLRDLPSDKAKEFLLNIGGLGLKSAECVRLLMLHHNAFPVDRNVGRIATRLGWVPLQPLPEEVQIHLLNAYPMVDKIQKYLYPRLCTLGQEKLYELHYQLITFGKVFCTKIKPNCNACPMRAECRHYASAFASARLALPGTKESSNVTSIVPAGNEENTSMHGQPPSSFDLEVNNFGSSYQGQIRTCEPIIEIPQSPEPGVESVIGDIEDLCCESDDDEIPTIRLNTQEFKETLKETIETDNISIPEADVSRALVSFSAKAANVPVPPKKFVAKSRTMRHVYELPDFHPVLAGFEERARDDPTPYLLAVWFQGEVPNLLEYTENKACVASNDNLEVTVKATILIPCRTANRGTFPLNGTYFQVNEVFADDETSHSPMDVPRRLLCDLPSRELGCGASTTSIFKALPTGAIQRLFWKGSICVKGFNRKTRQPRHLHPRFHISTTTLAAKNRKARKR
ncbi:hypothetical protein SSX86_003015 [Deinandra increscens subsp. villosa]|uniref:HhH-GPD domain-containing protein n=1 Tax=Deinandra increscens subsp. villosa TaxID=3103831 RepID=A0AAP0H7P2_9ASTR